MKQPSIAIIGAGRLGSALATKLHSAGYRISEIVARDRKSMSRVRRLASAVGAIPSSIHTAKLDAGIVWFCVPDAQITAVARAISLRSWNERIALHSSGVLGSNVLEVRRQQGASIASAHPLMTFVSGSAPELAGVSFAIEGDASAVRAAKGIVRRLGGKPVNIREQDKPGYHLFATMICPLFVSLLAASERAAGLAGISPLDARRRMLPIIRQTVSNYEKLGPGKSFTGPIVRGDVETIRRHLDALAAIPELRDAYAALVRAALRNLPSRNAGEIRETLREVAGPAKKPKAPNRKGREGTRKGR